MQSALAPVIHLRVTLTRSLFFDPSPLVLPANKFVYAEFGLYFLVYGRLSVADASFRFLSRQTGRLHDIDLRYRRAERNGEQRFAKKILVCVDRDRTHLSGPGYVAGFLIKNYSCVY